MNKTSLTTHHCKVSHGHRHGCSSKLSFGHRHGIQGSGAIRRTRLPVGMTIVRAVSAPESFTAWDTATQRVAKRDDIKTIMLLGAGPIVIGQVRCRSLMHLPLLGHWVGLMN